MIIYKFYNELSMESFRWSIYSFVTNFLDHAKGWKQWYILSIPRKWCLKDNLTHVFYKGNINVQNLIMVILTKEAKRKGTENGI